MRIHTCGVEGRPVIIMLPGASAIGSCKTLIPLRITNWSAATAMWDTPGSILQNTVTGFLRRHGVIT